MDKNQHAVAIFNKLAGLYQDKFMDVQLYKDTLDFFCDNITVHNASLLELACGPGNITRYLLTQRPDLKILGTDLAPAMLELAAMNNLAADFQLLDCRSIASLEKQYDAIMCGFCLPYLSREETASLIHDAATLLHPRGLLYISTMEDAYSKSGFRKGSTGDEIYMHYHEGDFLVHTLEENQFRILKLQRQDYPSTDEIKTTDLIIIAQK